MQSDRFFNALKGHGTLCRLVVLPFESHGYAARESIMHVLWETDRWLQNYCIANTEDQDPNPESNSSENNKQEGIVDSESKTLGSTEGAKEFDNDETIRFYHSRRSFLW